MKIAENLFDLNGKNAVVVGGAGGIGQAIAQGLAMYGANVVIASRKVESLQRAQKEIKESCGCEVIYYTVDAGAEESVKELYEKTVQQLKHIDILVNAQGFNKKYPITEMDAKVWDQMFQVNVKSVMLTMKYYGRHMKEDVGKGKIINLSSVRGIRACGGGNSGYGATKGAVDMLTRMAAKDLGPYVYVNAIGPTITYTPMMKEFFRLIQRNVPQKQLICRFRELENRKIVWDRQFFWHLQRLILFPDRLFIRMVD